MKKVALVFVLAVLVPSLLLAWLAVRSLRDQQFLVERQQSLLDQHVTDSLAQNISDYLAQRQQEFSAQVEDLAKSGDARVLASQFDDQIRRRWPLADVGFCVTAAGKILSPLPNARPAAQMFRLDNSGFLGNREPVEVYLTANNTANPYNGNAGAANTLSFSRSGQGGQSVQAPGGPAGGLFSEGALPSKSVVQAGATNPASPIETLAVGGGGGGGANNSSRNAPAPGGMIAGTMSDNFSGRNGGANGGLNSNRGQGNQMSFAFNNASSDSAPVPPPAQRKQSSVDGRAGNPDSSPSSQAFVIGGNGRGGFGGGANSSSPSAPVSMAASPVAAEPDTLVQEQQKTEVATAKGLSETTLATDDTPRQNPTLAENAAPKDLPVQQLQNQNTLNYKAAESRKVSPQSKAFQNVDNTKVESPGADTQDNLSKVVAAEAEFRQLIGDQTDGMLARFLQNKLKLMCWHRLSTDPDLIFGAQLNLDRVVDGLRSLVQPWGDEICLAVLDDNARPVVLSRANFQGNWKRPFVATEVGDALPHWEVAAYLVNPAQLTQAARTAKLTLGLLIAVLVVAIGIGSLLIVRGLETELKLARQKTDFVSNVSHELKTPLTSIRMFSELLAEGRVADPAKQRSYLQIITAEAARLTRLINNVLDFSRMERGEKKYSFQPCDLAELVRATAETFRPHLEAAGFQFVCEAPGTPIPLRGDADALSQIIVNLLSNAEKYSAGSAGSLPAGAPGREISLQLAQKQSPLPHAEIKVLDRGPGIPKGSEEKIFEKFYRAHDSLSSGIQGSGLGLTIARQIARAHGGDVVYEPREGGGSCFIVRLPILTADGDRLNG